MSGICDTCKIKSRCISPVGGLLACPLYEEDRKNRWFQLFGTPERAARTICRQLKYGNICVCDGCPVKPTNRECDSEYDALLEWLRSDA